MNWLVEECMGKRYARTRYERGAVMRCDRLPRRFGGGEKDTEVSPQMAQMNADKR
jgi:hypothetical protein